ncbi:MAG: coproporphyrinogen III oxidase, partial [Flavitalea sp.]
MTIKDRFQKYLSELQLKITSALEKVDGKAKFIKDPWTREEGGGGLSMVISDGNVFEKGGVNTSAVYGPLPLAMQQAFGVGESNFFACGLSLVIHPLNPYVPTVHANWRYFELYDTEGKQIDSWF